MGADLELATHRTNISKLEGEVKANKVSSDLEFTGQKTDISDIEKKVTSIGSAKLEKT